MSDNSLTIEECEEILNNEMAKYPEQNDSVLVDYAARLVKLRLEKRVKCDNCNNTNDSRLSVNNPTAEEVEKIKVAFKEARETLQQDLVDARETYPLATGDLLSKTIDI